MLSGIWPRGNSSAPASGNTGITSGSSAGPRYSALIGIDCPISEVREVRLAPPLVNLANEGRMTTRSPRCSTSPPHAVRRGRLPSRKQNRRQPLPSLDGGFVGGAPGFEELHELLARAVFVPLAIA